MILRKVLFAFVLCSFMSGCHTIRPPHTATSTYTADIVKRDAEIGLVMDSAYTSYVSRDRGNAVADPQKYVIGASLAPMTESFFNHAYSKVNVYDSMPEPSDISEEDFVIATMVTDFDNDITMSTQGISLNLRANVYDNDLNLVKTVNSMGSSEGGVGLFHTSKKAGATVSVAMQDALSELVREVGEATA